MKKEFTSANEIQKIKKGNWKILIQILRCQKDHVTNTYTNQLQGIGFLIIGLLIHTKVHTQTIKYINNLLLKPNC